MLNHSTDDLDWGQTKLALKLFQDGEEYLAGEPSKRALNSYCGKYSHPDDAEFFVEEVFMKDDELYARFKDADEEFENRLYRIEKKTFGRIGGFTKLVFDEDGAYVNGVTCKKL